jgi:hypothetical protein
MQVNAVSKSNLEEEELEQLTLSPVIASLNANVPNYMLIKAPCS